MLQFLAVLSCVAGLAQCWVNDFDQPVHFECPDQTFLTHILSQHSNRAEDRVWDFGCTNLTDPLINCQWSDYVNGFDEILTFQCPDEGFITGTSSVHDNRSEDRRFRFKCCEVAEKVVSSCFFTDWVNALDGHMDYVVPKERVLRGADSYHDNRSEDRRWKFEICTLHS